MTDKPAWGKGEGGKRRRKASSWCCAGRTSKGIPVGALVSSKRSSSRPALMLCYMPAAAEFL